MDLHQNHEYLVAFERVRSRESRSPEDVMKALAVCASCAASGMCSMQDKHKAQIDELLSLLVTKD